MLSRLKGEQGDIVVFAPQNALIITDLASNINRMMKVLREIDQPGAGEKVWIISLKNTAASEMAQKLGEIFQVQQVQKKGGGARRRAERRARPKIGDLTAEMIISKIIPDERSNQLIVIATERSYQRVKRMVEQLDKPIEDGDGRIHVYYCENANCDELAQTLGSVTGVTVSVSQGGARAAAVAGRRGAGAGAAPAPGGQAGAGDPEPAVRGRGPHQLRSPDQLADHRVVAEGLPGGPPGDRAARFAAQAGVRRGDDPRGHAGQVARARRVVPRREAVRIPGLDNQSLAIGGLNPAKTLFPAGALTETMLAGVLGPVLIARRGQEPRRRRRRRRSTSRRSAC